MNVLFSKDGEIIPPHLNHTLKSYYYTTNTKIFSIDEKGLVIDYYPQKNHFVYQLDNQFYINIIDLIKKNLHCDSHNKSSTYTYNYLGFINFLVSPIFFESTLRGALIAGPICNSIEEKNNTIRQIIPNSDDFKRIELLINHVVIKQPPRSFYLSQLLHHLQGKSIYIGPNQTGGITKNYINPDDMKSRESHQKPNQIIVTIADMVVSGKKKEALELYKKALMLGDFFSETGEDNLNNLKSELLSLGVLVSHNLTKSGCDTFNINSTKAMFFHRILNSNSFQCLYQCGESIINKFSEILVKKTFSGKSKPVRDTISYIQEHFKEKIQIDDICQNVFLSKAYLSTIFRKETGMTIVNLIKKYRIKHSKYLLLNTNSSILKIAIESGFESQNYFSSVFRSEMKMTPRQFRNNSSKAVHVKVDKSNKAV